MKLLNNLYTVIDNRRNDEGFSCRIRLNADSIIFKAHFPGQPITPGACIINMAQELYELMSDRAADIVRIKNVKFLSVMTPDDDGVFVFRYTNIAKHDDNVEFNVSVSSGDTTYARLTLACRQT